jgi:peptide/nickel transport system permease protein
MGSYLLRRLFYALPILIGVNLITFALFFFVNSPDDMARLALGGKHVTPEAVQKWKADKGYDRPRFYNAEASGFDRFSDTIFFDKSVRMFVFDFGRSDDGRDIGHEIRAAWRSRCRLSWWGLPAMSRSRCCWPFSARLTSTSSG